MKLTLKNPITHDGNEYPFASLSLSISTGFNNADTYTLAMRLVPYRITDDGAIEKLDSHAIGFSTLNALQDAALQPLAESVIENVQTLINR
jgi:hypothetical protein